MPVSKQPILDALIELEAALYTFVEKAEDYLTNLPPDDDGRKVNELMESAARMRTDALREHWRLE